MENNDQQFPLHESKVVHQQSDFILVTKSKRPPPSKPIKIHVKLKC